METNYVVTYIDRNAGSLEAYHALVPAGSPGGAADLLLATRAWAQVVDVSELAELRGILDALEAQSAEEIVTGVLGLACAKDDLDTLLPLAVEAGSPSIAAGIESQLRALQAARRPTGERPEEG